MSTIVLGLLIGSVQAHGQQINTINAYQADIEEVAPGMDEYDAMNAYLGGDSLRHCEGYACGGWVIDEYENGQVKHRGYYQEGQITSYKNYHDNGKMERDFKMISTTACKMTIYARTGHKLLETQYSGGFPYRWTVHYKNGLIHKFVEYTEDRSAIRKMNTYWDSGLEQRTVILSNASKGIFQEKNYYENGQVNSKGHSEWKASTQTFARTGKWTFYNQKGKKLRTVKY